MISIQSVSNTEVFKISVSNENNVLAANIANELLNVFSNEVKSLYNMNNVYIMDLAEPSDSPYNINHVKDLAIFGVIGFIASFGLVIIIYLFDTTIKSEDDVEKYSGLAVLSTIPIYQNKKEENDSELIVNEQPKSPISECFKTFRTNVMFSIQNKKLNTILVTSGFMSEGKSFVSSNLAVTFAQSGKKVILVDTDMRKGRVHKIFGISNKNLGLSNCLSDIGNNGVSVNINKYIQKSGIPNLHIMTSGDVPPNPSELLSSPNMKKFLEALNSQYDIVICDGTPCMLVSDSIILSKIVDTTVIVTANRSTKLDTLLKMKKSIEIVGGNIGGVVINKMTMSAKSYQNGYYYGNHNEIDTKMDFVNECDDSVLESELCINPLFVDNEIVEKDTSTTVCENSYDLTDLSNMMQDNLREIAELKGLYNNVMRTSLDAIAKNSSTSSVMEELANIKELYTSNILKQDEQIATLNEKISNFEMNDNSDVLDELNNLKSIYKDAINKEKDELLALNNKISNFEIKDNSDIILDELKSIKSSYELEIDSQNERIAALDEKISNFKVEDNSDVILDELENMKSSYEMAIDAQNERISTLDDKVSNFKVEDNSDVILDELENMKSSYEMAIDAQNERIATLDDKVSNFKVEDNSDAILDELENMKSSYEMAIDAQNERISNLDDKVSNFKVEDNSDAILDELKNMRSSYEMAIDAQNERISNLNDKVSSFNVNDNSELLKEFSNIYKQLETMNARFDALEETARNNEVLIKNINKSSRNTFDIKKSDKKVIMIQDYLENGYSNIIELNNNTDTVSNKSIRKNKNILDGQLNMLDNVLDNIKKSSEKDTSYQPSKKANTDTNKIDFSVDYERVNNKQKRGFSIFKSKAVEPVYEEPIHIVSQILSGNNVEESVG